jgi:hypothetical protein
MKAPNLRFYSKFFGLLVVALLMTVCHARASEGMTGPVVGFPATGGAFNIGSLVAGNIDAAGFWRPGSAVAATIGTCGTSPTITGNNVSGTFLTGSGALTACTITFASTATTAPRSCILFPANAAAAATGTTGAYVSSVTTTTFVVTGLNLTSAAYYYQCF